DDARWAVGVAKDSVERKGHMELTPEGGVWAVRHCKGQFVSLTSPRNELSPVPRRIWVCLDCAEGSVTFVSAETGAEIF
ncbi:TRI26 protein, partial [Ciccaba nigrolineata]|nr:TRI26 protein [Ciccaba nigrolineata]